VIVVTGKKAIGSTKVQILEPFNDTKVSKYRQRILRKTFRRRAAIEPIIGRLKTDHRLSRNFYKGIFGDKINVLLATAAFNFKKKMKIWKDSLSFGLENFFRLGHFFFSSLNLYFTRPCFVHWDRQKIGSLTLITYLGKRNK
jgi:IS5 family transposase